MSLRFYRAVYSDSDDLTGTEIEASAHAGRLPVGRPLNPIEFVRRSVANGLLPEGFDPIGYRVQHPELWGPDRQDWEAAVHFIKAGHPLDKRWERPFDANFYRELYPAATGITDLEQLRKQWLADLTLKAVFRLALRQTEGLIGSIIRLLGLNLAIPGNCSPRLTKPFPA